MKEYIEREAAVTALAQYFGFTSVRASIAAEKILAPVPAADVVEVRHGTPIRHSLRFCNSDGEVIREIMDGWECPFCHNTGAENYCPNCGAKMDGGNDR